MYAIIEADGFFGDKATVCQVHADQDKAIKSVRNDRRWQVIGDCDSEFELGQKIYRDAIGQIYPRVEKTPA